MNVHKKKLSVLLVLVLALAAALSGCAPSATPQSTEEPGQAEFDLSVYKNNDFLITPQDLKAMLGSEDLVLVDANKPDVYGKEHIPGAISAGLHSFSNTVGKPGEPGWGTILDKDALTEKLNAMGINNEKTVVFYSDVFKGPGADGRAVWQLQMAGMDNVKLLVGGLSYWKELGYEVTAEVSEPVPTTGVVLKDYDESFGATKDYVFENLGKQVLIDVRTPKEYGGSQNAGEPRGGHITGATNLLWLDLLNENGTPKSPEEITKIMADAGVSPEDDFTLY